MGDLALISMTGRRSGVRYAFPVTRHEDGDTTVVVTLRARGWWRNLTGGTPVDMRHAGAVSSGHAHAAAAQASDMSLLEDFFRQHRINARMHGVGVTSAGHVDRRRLIAACREIVVIRIRPAPPTATPPAELATRWEPPYAAMAAGAAAVAMLSTSAAAAFERYLAGVPPLVAVVGAGVAGWYALRFLERQGWWTPQPPESVGRAAKTILTGAALFGAAAIAADVFLTFPRDLNVVWPEALLFYPAIAYLAEIGFHVLPLAIMAKLVALWRTEGTRARDLWVAVLIVATIEAVFQACAAVLGGAGTVLTAFVAVHLTAIGVFELVLFRRYGFAPMLGFRLAYYTLWHLAWGAIRLELLF